MESIKKMAVKMSPMMHHYIHFFNFMLPCLVLFVSVIPDYGVSVLLLIVRFQLLLPSLEGNQNLLNNYRGNRVE